MDSLMKYFIILIMFLAPICANAHNTGVAPELWSWFKQLNKSAAACNIQSRFILDKIGLKNLIENDYGIYGTYKNNRVVVKCLQQNENSILWVAVAGHDKDSVELIRNKIISDIK